MSHEYETIDLTREDTGRATVTLDRPEALNALSDRMAEELFDALESLTDEAVRVLVIRGGDGTFCAGADVGSPPQTTAPHEQTRRFRRLRRLFDRIELFPRPTVAAIDGYCLGGGCELACCCDTRIATADATIGVPEIRLGVIPALGGTQRLSRLVGLSRARDMVLRGKHYDAATMHSYGFLHEVADEGEDAFEDLLEDVVDDYLSRPPIAMEFAKRVVNEGVDAPLEAGLEMESLATGVLYGTADAREGLEAFREDRRPEFEGA